MTNGQTVVLTWFAASVAVSVLGNAAFYFWLRARGAGVRFLWAGSPGYLDRQYAHWCRASGRSPRHLLLLRRLSYVNLILAIVFAVPLLAGGH